jgi:hypothetical protein
MPLYLEALSNWGLQQKSPAKNLKNYRAAIHPSPFSLLPYPFSLPPPVRRNTRYAIRNIMQIKSRTNTIKPNFKGKKMLLRLTIMS